MSAHSAEIVIEPYKKIIIHEVLENRFADFVDMILTATRSAGGTTIPILSWSGGVVFQITPFNPTSEAIIKEQLNGVIHYGAVNFAMKEKFENEVRTPQGTIRLVDQSSNPNFVKLAGTLRSISKLKD